MAVHVTAAQLAEYQRNLSGSGKLYSSAPKTGAKRKRRSSEQIRYERARATTAEHRATLLERRINAPPKQPRTPKPPPSRRERFTNAARRTGYRAVRSTGRAALRPVRNVGGGIATFFTLVVGMGVMILLFRNPQIITAPFAFIGNISSAFGALTRK